MIRRSSIFFLLAKPTFHSRMSDIMGKDRKNPFHELHSKYIDSTQLAHHIYAKKSFFSMPSKTHRDPQSSFCFWSLKLTPDLKNAPLSVNGTCIVVRIFQKPTPLSFYPLTQDFAQLFTSKYVGFGWVLEIHNVIVREFVGSIAESFTDIDRLRTSRLPLSICLDHIHCPRFVAHS